MTVFRRPPNTVSAVVEMTEQEFSCYVRGSSELHGYGPQNGERFWLHQGKWIKVLMKETGI